MAAGRCASGSTSGPAAAVPGRLAGGLRRRTRAASATTAANSSATDARGTARAPEGSGELVDVGRRSGRPKSGSGSAPTRAYSVAFRRFDAWPERLGRDRGRRVEPCIVAGTTVSSARSGEGHRRSDCRMMAVWLIRLRSSTATRESRGAFRFSVGRGCRFSRCSTTWKGARPWTSSSISSRRSQGNRRLPRSTWLGIPSWPVRVLLDENLPRALAAELTGHDVSTVQAENWSSRTNGELLWCAQGSFDALLTMDRGLQ